MTKKYPLKLILSAMHIDPEKCTIDEFLLDKVDWIRDSMECIESIEEEKALINALKLIGDAGYAVTSTLPEFAYQLRSYGFVSEVIFQGVEAYCCTLRGYLAYKLLCQ